MSREKQIEEFVEVLKGVDRWYHAMLGYYESYAHAIYNAGYRKQEWISVNERLPETTAKEVKILDQEIGSGAITNETDAGIAQVSELVAVLCKRCINGEVNLYHDYDYTLDGKWVYCMGVTHWMPLPQPPNMKGGAE